MTADQLMKEIERYLAAVALFRQLGHEPEWVCEEIATVVGDESSAICSKPSAQRFV
jgi:hypothetical protein